MKPALLALASVLTATVVATAQLATAARQTNTAQLATAARQTNTAQLATAARQTNTAQLATAARQTNTAQQGGTASPAQDPHQPTFRTGVDVITVDVGAVDGRGQPVIDLHAPEFTVKIDGQVRRVVTADLVKYEYTPDA